MGFSIVVLPWLCILANSSRHVKPLGTCYSYNLLSIAKATSYLCHEIRVFQLLSSAYVTQHNYSPTHLTHGVQFPSRNAPQPPGDSAEAYNRGDDSPCNGRRRKAAAGGCSKLWHCRTGQDNNAVVRDALDRLFYALRGHVCRGTK